MSTYRILLLLWAVSVAMQTVAEPGPEAGQSLTAEQRFVQYSRRARDNDAAAQYQLGRMYAIGRGTKRDYRAARHWYGKAAAAGSVMAEYRLGVLMFRGLGGDKDLAEARRLFALAARRGYAGAQFMLGNIYKQGLGIDKSPQQARFWYQQAAANGHQNARLALAGVADNGIASGIGRESASVGNLLISVYKQEWGREDDPAQILPSSMTRCEWRGVDEFECLSDTMFRNSGSLDVLYRTRARIRRDDTGGLMIRYRNNILDVHNNAGKNPAASALGWQHQEHVVHCRAQGAGSLSCTSERGEKMFYSSSSSPSQVVQSGR